MIFVIANCHRHFRTFVQQWGLGRMERLGAVMFISHVDQLRGLDGNLVLLAPTWWMGRGGSNFAKSCDEAGIELNSDLKRNFPRLKFLEVL